MEDEQPDGTDMPATRRGRPPVQSEAERRTHILRVARLLFLEEGYGSTSMDRIATACQISKRTLYALFAAKADVFAAVVEADRRSILALPGSEPMADPRLSLELMFRLDLSADEEADYSTALRLVMVDGQRFPELIRIVSRIAGDARDQLADWIAGEMEAGRLGSGNALHQAAILLNMVFGDAGIEAGNSAHWFGVGRREHIVRCIEIFLRGTQAGR